MKQTQGFHFCCVQQLCFRNEDHKSGAYQSFELKYLEDLPITKENPLMD